ncbi:MAG TPA: hypothetical protein PLD59_00200 [Tepidisphaeraceae bacterium]|nr:hypothetical protein [Tepidisphaeraceae bacterium]
MPDETEYGWNGGRHILDSTFSFESNVYAEALHIGLRIDTNRVPAEVKQAYLSLEEQVLAAGNPSGFISKNQKRDARDIVRRKIDDDLRSGQYRRSKLYAVLWDLPSSTVYAAVNSAAEEKLVELFSRTFGLELAAVSAGALALRLLEPRGRRRDLEDARPSRFVFGPEGESQTPDYPWTAKLAESRDFLGNEFLTWLWHEVDRRDGYVGTADGDAAVMFDRSLDLECAYGESGKVGLKSIGPTRMSEATAALRSGKVPRKSGLTIEFGGSQYVFTLSAESLAITGLKLPAIEEADTPRVLFEERIGQLREFCGVIDKLFAAFLEHRAGPKWEGVTLAIRKWITTPPGRTVFREVRDSELEEVVG